jgi:drug/metabolite transporter (DMT)-like permease
VDDSFKKGVAAGIGSLVCMGIGPTFNKLALAHYSSLQAVFINVICGAIFSFFYSLKDKTPAPKASAALVIAMVLHALGIVFLFACIDLLHPFFVGLTGRFYTFFSVGLAVVVLGETLSFKESALLVLSLVCFSLFDFTDYAQISWKGISYGILYTACFSLNNLLIKKKLESNSHAKILFYSNLVSVLVLSTLVFPTTKLYWSSQGVALIAVASLVSSFLGTLYFYRSLELLDFSTATTLRSVSPVAVALVAVLFFPLKISPASACVGLAGVFLLSGFTYQRSRKPRTTSRKDYDN